MTSLRLAAGIVLISVLAFAFCLPAFRSNRYDEQFRDHAAEPPSRAFPLGTDDLGRDRLSRLAFATRVSVSLAFGAAALSAMLGLAGAVFSMSLLRKPITAAITICLSLPWMFVFVIVRGALPLNTAPLVSIAVTFAVMGFAGWAPPARVFTACLDDYRRSEWVTFARATGIRETRIWTVHIWPHVRSVVWAQIRALIPAYILAEAGLGLLGLGVAEPATSLGNLIAELQRAGSASGTPWLLAPLAVLALTTVSIEMLRRHPEKTA